jgi:hypothetical protein
MLGLPVICRNFVWDFALSKLYTNALMSTLNARTVWGGLINGGTVPPNVLFGTESHSQVRQTPLDLYRY